MRNLGVDRNNDIYVDASGRLAQSVGLAACMQTCEHVMQAVLNEMTFHQHRGLPYFETVWIGNPNLRLFDSAARKALQGVRGVLSVTAFSSSIEGNVLQYRAAIRTEYGDAALSGDV
jgi:uncharacterized protein YwlG (UPF0340 family)